MQVFNSLSVPIVKDRPVVLTVGNFDGVHRGHLALIHQARELSRDQKRKLALVTFENHPLSLLRPDQPVYLLCTLTHKLRLFEQAGVDIVILLKFTKELSQKTAEEFLRDVYNAIPFSEILLGHDATIGRNKQGDHKEIRKIADQLGIKVDSIPPYRLEEQILSSSIIRKVIQNGDLVQAQAMLGRPFSIYAPIVPGQAKGKTIGFPTANIEVRGLCLPPLGVYAVQVVYQDRVLNAVANLGVAPTLRQDPTPLLEVHLLDHSMELYGKYVEIVFREYIRAERKFSTVQDLQKQIKEDIQRARTILHG